MEQKRLKTKHIAQLVVNQFWEDGTIKQIWTTEDSHYEAFEQLKELVRQAIVTHYGKEMLHKCSSQFIGYSAHYVFVKCANTFGYNFKI